MCMEPCRVPLGAVGHTELYNTSGPFTHEEAKANAEKRARHTRASGKRYAVVQVVEGNTVRVQPPAPPEPLVVWS